MTRPVLIGNSSGFYGDRDAAMREMVEGGPIDVLTGDYLAELTMLILVKARQKDPAATRLPRPLPFDGAMKPKPLWFAMARAFQSARRG